MDNVLWQVVSGPWTDHREREARLVGDGCQLDWWHIQTVGANRTERLCGGKEQVSNYCPP